MACNGCGKSGIRHSPKVIISGDVDNKPVPISTGKSFAPEIKNPPETSKEAFNHAKELSFEDIIQRQIEHQKRVNYDIEDMYSQMTEPMRHFHILSLLANANYENQSMPGVSPDQAVVAIKSALDREDFNEINRLYPTLKNKIGERYKELMQKRITL